VSILSLLVYYVVANSPRVDRHSIWISFVKGFDLKAAPRQNGNALATIDERCHVARAEPVIDVDHAHIGGARVHHA
jgi:hypothetical protein